MTMNELPMFFEDPEAVKAQDDFASENLWKGKAITAFRGRGVYEGTVSYQEKGKKVHSHFRFVLKEDSLKAFLIQVKHFIHHPDPEHEERAAIKAGLDRLESDLNYCHIQKEYSEDEATPVLYLNRKGIDADRLVRNIMEYMYDQGTEIKWFATAVYQNGKIAGLVTPENETGPDHKNAEKIRADLSRLSEDILEPCFASLVKKNGAEKTDGIVFCTAAPGYDQTDRHYNGAIKAIYDDLGNSVIIQTPAVSEKKKRGDDLLEEKRKILEKFQATHPTPVKRLKPLKESAPAEQKTEDPETDDRVDEIAREEAERIQNWMKPGNPEEWKGIALNQYEGVGQYEGVIQYESTEMKFELILRKYDFTVFLSYIEKLSIVDETGKHSVGNGEAKLKEIHCVDGLYEAMDPEDKIEDDEYEDLDDYISQLPDNILEAHEDLSDTLIRGSLRDGSVVHVNMNGKDESGSEMSILDTMDGLISSLEELLQESLDWNGPDHASSLIVLTRVGRKDQNVIMYDAEHNALILKCTFAKKEKTK